MASKYFYSKPITRNYEDGFRKGRHYGTEKALKEDLLLIYSALNKVLYNRGFNQDQIEDFLAEMRDVIFDMSDREIGIEAFVKEVEELTGIQLINA